MEQVIKLIKSAKSAVILPHVNADGDAIASSKAMQKALESINIPAVIYAEEPVEKRLDFISEGVLVYNGEEVKCDTCIIIDCGDFERTGARGKIAESANKVINIDHHRTNVGFGDGSLVRAEASSAGEVLFDLFKEMNIDITAEIARYLYTAICSDTGGFAFSNVSPKTFRTAAELIEKDICHAEISRLLFECVDIDEELMRSELTKNIKSYSDGRIRTVVITKSLAAKFGVSPKEMQGIVDIPRRIRGTEIAVALKETDGCTRVSMRSNTGADVSEVALKFGGGGHSKAAGCSISEENAEEAEKIVVKALQEVIE